MTDLEYKNTLSEVSTILKYLDKSLVKKIPQSLLYDIESNKSKDYIFNYNPSKSLHEQKILKTTEQYLTMLFLKFMCTEEEKKEVLASMDKNENSYQKQLQEQYNPDNLFGNKQSKPTQENSLKNENYIMPKNNDSFLKKCICKIKNFFRKNKTM